MTASDDELGLRRWSGMAGNNGMHPPMGGKSLYITDSPKSRDMITHYNTFAFWPSVKQKYFTIQYDTIYFLLNS